MYYMYMYAIWIPNCIYGISISIGICWLWRWRWWWRWRWRWLYGMLWYDEIRKKENFKENLFSVQFFFIVYTYTYVCVYIFWLNLKFFQFGQWTFSIKLCVFYYIIYIYKGTYIHASRAYTFIILFFLFPIEYMCIRDAFT